jgi:hypothetical protein
VPRASDHVSIGGVALPFGSHLCGFYSTNKGRTKLVSFLAGGLVPGAVCYLVADRAVQREILTQLGMDQAALEKEMAAGRLEHAATWKAQQKNFKRLFMTAIAGGAHSLRLVLQPRRAHGGTWTR